MLRIKNLCVSLDGQSILHDIQLEVARGQKVVLMGPNGSGKSSLCHVLIGTPSYIVESGHIIYKEQELLPMSPLERSIAGLFLAFQHPISIEHVTLLQLLKAMLDEQRKSLGLYKMASVDFLSLVKGYCQLLAIDVDELKKPFNLQSSGGEKKKNEALQALLLQPSLLVLDELDSGLDLDTLKQTITLLCSRMPTMLVITHYTRMLQYIEPDAIYILLEGKIAAMGGMDIASKLDTYGYQYFTKV